MSFSRWYRLEGARRPLEACRTVALAAQSLVDRGVQNPRRNILVYKAPPSAVGATVATTLASPDPSPTETSRRSTPRPSAWASRASSPPRSRRTRRRRAHGTRWPRSRGGRLREDISPPSDDRPFFFQMADLQTVFSRRIFENTLVTRPVLVLALLAITVLGLDVYFAGIGLAFLLIEIAQLQRLSIHLGNPTYALTVVLFSILLFSGIGSMLTERFVRTDRPATLIAPLVVLLVVVAIMGAATPEIIRATDASTTPTRIAIAVGMLMPLGLAMGMPFAIGMRVAGTRPGAPTAFLWGINGAMSVSASVFGVVIALSFGISTSCWVGAAAYGITLLVLAVIARRHPTPALPPDAVGIREPADPDAVLA